MSYEQDMLNSAAQTKAFAAEMELEAARASLGTEQARGCPSMILRPRLSKDGNEWCALYGENLQDGVAGFGASPDLAMRDFDMNWVKPLEGSKE